MSEMDAGVHQCFHQVGLGLCHKIDSKFGRH